MAGKNIFNSVKMTRPKTSVFDLSHDVKLSLNMGQLVPIMCTECIPGDKFNISCESLIRFAPLISPMMHRVDVTMHYYFVPNRLLWSNWELFITNSIPAGGSEVPAFPTIDLTGASGGFGTANPVAGGWGLLHDYLGIPEMPVGAINAETISALPFAAYFKVWNDYYRDQNVQPDLWGNRPYLADGDNTSDVLLTALRNRAWEHDYFTAALPWAQKGDTVDLPLASFNDVPVRVNLNQPGATVGDFDGTAGNASLTGDIPEGASVPNTDGMFAETSQLLAQSTTINDLRTAFKLQEWLEKNARAGTRYVESILAHFGVRSSDARLQRPEYITGTKSPVVVSEVLNTTGTEDLPQGNMAGHAVSVTSGQYGNYRCEEHGYIIGIMSVMPKTAYQQGIPKHFLKINDFTNYAFPSFAHLGEQAIENREIMAFQGALGDNTFGYVPRYAEYKFENNRVAGDFRNSLDFWHMGRIFDPMAPPALNAAFITADPTTRVFAVEGANEQHLYAHVYNKVRAVRPLPKFGTPTF